MRRIALPELMHLPRELRGISARRLLRWHWITTFNGA